MAEIGSIQLDDTPVNGQTEKGITSNWAYDHNADTTKHHAVFVDRGDPAAIDYSQATFTLNGAWHDLDLSSIVPAGAISVLLRLSFASTSVGNSLAFRKNGNTNAYNRSKTKSVVASVWHEADLIVPLDTNRIVEYAGDSSVFEITVGGWWI